MDMSATSDEDDDASASLGAGSAWDGKTEPPGGTELVDNINPHIEQRTGILTSTVHYLLLLYINYFYCKLLTSTVCHLLLLYATSTIHYLLLLYITYF